VKRDLGDGYELDDDRTRLDRDAVHAYLGGEAYWAKGRTRERQDELIDASVRVVGTNAFRVARKKQFFLDRARHALGHPIEIISGVEEARLIYSGVANTSPGEPGRRLVVDVGGGSTELIVGEGVTPLQLQSLWMGCVSFSERFFPEGRISSKRVHRARVASRQLLEPVAESLKTLGWQTASGSAEV